MDAREIFSILAKQHQAKDGWAFFRETRVGAGWSYHYYNQGSNSPATNPENRVDQSIDAWGMLTWPSGNFLRVSYEIKVSRGDWIRERDNPRKREAGMALSNQFYFVCPEDDIIFDHEVPDDCGLYYVTKTSKTLRRIKLAPHRQIEPLPMSFMAMILRRACAAEVPAVAGEADSFEST